MLQQAAAPLRHNFVVLGAYVSDRVYLLYHIRAEGQLLLCGVYESEEDAVAAIQRLRGKPGFARYPNDFEYHAYTLGIDIWSEGFTENECDVAPESEKRPN